ncbi:hypothetical protein CNMCM8927_004078 [Aspergillus lentulus]|uniref:Conidial yellow pigment biosynthesis polyketide synthase n=2 Tax=Aspergillus lentulus TaxID=293939 RepID=A0AAN6BS69_ASPLE|nr:hypothetical protein CNMCM8927_004078 [Aspergillus lentulus]
MRPVDFTPSSESPTAEKGMKVVYFGNELPQDGLQGICRRLHAYTKDRRYPLLARFIEESTWAVRDEVRQLHAAQRALVTPFESVLHLAEQPELCKGPLCGSIEGVLLCVIQLGTFIGYYETSRNEYAFESAHTYLTGLGLGLLTSTAVSLSPTLADLPLAGAEVVRVAFRLGVLVADVSQNLEPADAAGDRGSWAYVIPNITPSEAEEELTAIHKRENTPEASRIFISAISRTSVTISGPPARLKRLFRLSDFFRDRTFIALPVYGGLCHAKHIYSSQHARSVVQGRSIAALDTRFIGRYPILSTGSGEPFPTATTATELFEHVITEILTQAIEWENVIQGVVERAKLLSVSEVEVQVFRISLPVHDLLSALQTSIREGVEVTIKDLDPWITKAIDDEQSTPRGTAQSKIAIVGMSCRMPSGATDTERFWEILEQGLDVHRKIPPDRFDVDSHYDPAGKRVNASHTPYGCFIDEPGLFDAPFFNMSPREAQQTDPMQRLAIITAYEALERAGYVANRTPSSSKHRIGTFYGQASDDYREVNSAQEISTYFIPGGCRAFGPGRINYFFKLWGPSFSIDTACSSSLATIQAACTALWNGDTDTVVAGGMNVLTNSDAFAGLSHGHFLTKTPNACKTWDCEADGYCRADGVASIVMKRLEDAEADNDNILGVILGAATNHSAEAVSITHPHAGAQSFLSRQVLRSAGIDPMDVSYVEMHGTGTQAGDAEEMKSVSDVFAPAAERRSSKQPVFIGAVKANVGHGEAVAGVTALVKVLLMFQKEAIPPHVGIKNSINPGFPKDLKQRNLHIPYEKQPWPRIPGSKRIAMVNNFSAAGGNSTLAVEEGPLRPKPTGEIDPRSSHLVAVSAKSKVSLKGNLERLLGFLDAHPDVVLSDLAYTTTARRHHHNHRIAVATSDVMHLKKQLSASLESDSVNTLQPISATGPPPIAFAFTGQGSSYKSWNLQLFHDSPYFRAQILHLDMLAQGQGFPSFVPAIDGSYPRDHAHSAIITQLALVCTEIALAKYWASLGVKPDVVVGHSLGEYAALHIAGVLSASDAIFLVGQRACLLRDRCHPSSHQMMAVRASLAQIEQFAGTLPYEVACVNGPREMVLSGTREEMAAVAKPLEAEGFKCIVLEVAFAFHSAQMDPILEEFEALAASGVVFQAPNLPVISPLLSKVVFDEHTIDSLYMRRATRETVNFLSAMEMAHKISTIDDATVWVEIGPHPVCVNFVRSSLPSTGVTVPSLRRGEDNWVTLTNSLGALHCAGVPVDWNEFHQPFERALRLLDLPTYSWNEKTYWIQYKGNWALTKGNTFYDDEVPQTNAVAGLASELRTSTVQQIIHEQFDGTAGSVVMQSDLMQPDFLAAAYGHKMSGRGVVTSSIHADIAFTLGGYLYKKLNPNQEAHMNIANLEVLRGLVAQENTKSPQLIQVSASTENIRSGQAHLKWHNVINGSIEEPFASATIYYEEASEWLASWRPATHLVQGRIHALERLAEDGVANRFTRRMAYGLFASSLVDYADKYRGMQSVVLHELEAFADVVLTNEKGGTWTVPPYFIDSVAHLAGFIMNVSDANDTNANFCVTPGWSSMRFAAPLVAGNKYRSYVKMIPTVEDNNIYLGDVYILQNETIVGMVGGIKFRRYPRILLNRFFSAPDADGRKSTPAVPAPAPASTPAPPAKLEAVQPKVAPTSTPASPAPANPPTTNGVEAAAEPDANSTAAKAIALVATEAGLGLGDLKDSASFSSLGIDSLMSLVISEKFREALGVTVTGSLFLEYPTMDSITQLEARANEVAAAARKLADYCRNARVDGSCPQVVVPSEAPWAIREVRRLLLSNIDHLQTLLTEPTDLVQRLAVQSQLLACLQWLGEFQVLACLPLTSSVRIPDLARLSGVPETQLARIIRFTATAGFLQEPQPGHIAHSPLSSLFVSRPSLRDAMMFLADSATPAALQMASATSRFGDTVTSDTDTAYNIAFDHRDSFFFACEQRPKLHRRWSAYLQQTGSDASDLTRQVLARVDWFNLDNVSVVEVVGPKSSSAAMMLAQFHPMLHFIVQEARIPNWSAHPVPREDARSVQIRELGGPQCVRDAAIYILNLGPLPHAVLPTSVLAEVRAHFSVLAANSRAMLILTAGLLLPKPGTVDAKLEASVRLHDLSLLQLANDRLMDEDELVELVHSVKDSVGRLVVVNRLHLPHTTTVALGVKYQATGHGDISLLGQPA